MEIQKEPNHWEQLCLDNFSFIQPDNLPKLLNYDCWSKGQKYCSLQRVTIISNIFFVESYQAIQMEFSEQLIEAKKKDFSSLIS